MQIPRLQFTQMPIIQPRSEMAEFSNALLNAGAMRRDRLEKERERAAQEAQQQFQNQLATEQLDLQKRRFDLQEKAFASDERRAEEAHKNQMLKARYEIAAMEDMYKLGEVTKTPEFQADFNAAKTPLDQLEVVEKYYTQIGAHPKHLLELGQQKMAMLRQMSELETNDLRKQQIQLEMSALKAKMARDRAAAAMAQAGSLSPDEALKFAKEARAAYENSERVYLNRIKQINSAKALYNKIANGRSEEEIRALVPPEYKDELERQMAMFQGNDAERLEEMKRRALAQIGNVEELEADLIPMYENLESTREAYNRLAVMARQGTLSAYNAPEGYVPKDERGDVFAGMPAPAIKHTPYQMVGGKLVKMDGSPFDIDPAIASNAPQPASPSAALPTKKMSATPGEIIKGIFNQAKRAGEVTQDSRPEEIRQGKPSIEGRLIEARQAARDALDYVLQELLPSASKQRFPVPDLSSDIAQALTASPTPAELLYPHPDAPEIASATSSAWPEPSVYDFTRIPPRLMLLSEYLRDELLRRRIYPDHPFTDSIVHKVGPPGLLERIAEAFPNPEDAFYIPPGPSIPIEALPPYPDSTPSLSLLSPFNIFDNSTLGQTSSKQVSQGISGQEEIRQGKPSIEGRLVEARQAARDALDYVFQKLFPSRPQPPAIPELPAGIIRALNASATPIDLFYPRPDTPGLASVTPIPWLEPYVYDTGKSSPDSVPLSQYLRRELLRQKTRLDNPKTAPYILNIRGTGL